MKRQVQGVAGRGDQLGMGKRVVLEAAEVGEDVGHGHVCPPSQDNGPCRKGRKRLATEGNTTDNSLAGLCEGTTLALQASLHQSLSC